MQCSIVIRTFNEERFLRYLLNGLQQQTVQDIEVIVVDSGSSDQTVAIAQASGAKVVHIPPTQFSFGRSLNLGIEAATREYVIIASAHVFPVFPDWLEKMIEPLVDTQIALSYGKQRGTGPEFISAGVPDTTKFSEREVFSRWFPNTAVPQQDHPFCNNANAAIRRSLWLQNKYDESLTGLEDLAWAKWALNAGYRLCYVPAAEVVHIHNETPKIVLNRYKREAMAFKAIYPEAHFNIYDAFRMFIGNAGNDIWHALRQGVLLRYFFSIIWFRYNQFWGTYLGYRQSVVWNWQLRQTFYYPRGTQVDETPEREVAPIKYDEI